MPSAFAQKACTEIGCINGVNFTVDPGYDWKSGLYQIEAALGFKKVSCYGTLPLHSCEEGPTFKCDDPAVQIQESGCALPQDAHGIGGIHINGDPARVIVRIARNNKTIVTRTVVPQYTTSQPNGPGCGPVCRSASFNLLSAQ